MNASQPSSIWTDPYWSRFREHAHLLIIKGYQGALTRIKAKEKRNETDVTGFITEAIDEWLLGSPDWWDGFFVQDDPPIPSKTAPGKQRTGRSRKRPDIIIGYARKPRPKYFFEAKRLRQSSHSGEYTALEGIGCFISGEYAHDYKEAAMLGYVEIETIEHWCKFLKREICSKEAELELMAMQEDVQIIDELPLEWVSKHKRNAVGKPITIFHILLDCSQ